MSVLDKNNCSDEFVVVGVSYSVSPCKDIAMLTKERIETRK